MEGTNKAHENGEAMGFVGARLTVMLGQGYWFWLLNFICEAAFSLAPFREKPLKVRVIDANGHADLLFWHTNIANEVFVMKCRVYDIFVYPD